MNYLTIKYNDIANGNGLRTSLFVSSCPHKCTGCFNPESWDPNAGQPFTCGTMSEILVSLKPSRIQGLSLLGGEPLSYDNIPTLKKILEIFRGRFGDTKDVWIWSGYTYDEIINCPDKYGIVSMCDVLIDGKFIESKKDLSLSYRGSSNQSIIDIKQSIDKMEKVWYDIE